ncbi:hypothetical protein GW17_00036862 [Ensete ventricosum]|nr:hypothetical protein GW17_00036862 [Ensete ventricosum]
MEELLVKSLPTATAEGRKGRWQLFGESFPFRMAVVVNEDDILLSVLEGCLLRVQRGCKSVDHDPHRRESSLDLVEIMQEYLVSESLMSMQGDVMKDP